MKEYDITPVAAPRQVRRDKWNPSKAVLKYRAFKDHVRELGIEVPESGAWLMFFIPMPPSWSRKKREQMLSQPHQQKPDVDNLVKALLDAIYESDCHIYDIRATKFWGETGKIIIEEGNENG